MTRALFALFCLAFMRAEAAEIEDGSKLFHLTLLGSRTSEVPQWYVSDDPGQFCHTYVAVVNISSAPVTLTYHSTGAHIKLMFKDEEDKVSSHDLIGEGSGINIVVTLKPNETEILPVRMLARKLDPKLRPGPSKEEIRAKLQAEVVIEVVKPDKSRQPFRATSEWFPFRVREWK